MNNSAVAAVVVLAALVAAGGAARAAGRPDTPADALAYDIFKQLIEIDTSDSTGSVTAASEALAQRFRAAGFAAADVAVLGPEARKKNLVVRLRGSGARRPVLLIGHLDVVDARRVDWQTDPFKLVEKDGYFYGRGVLDMKSGDAVMAATLLRLKQEGFRPDRDIILALTADEEAGCCNGPEWLLQNHRELLDAAFALNHDGIVGYSVISAHGVPQIFALSATEKTYGDYQLTVSNPGGHSSAPRADNAIYQLAQGLLRIAAQPFPFELNDITRAYFEEAASKHSGQLSSDMRAITRNPPDTQAISRLAADPEYNGLMRTTCVATRLTAGHANNALPQLAQANVNCRILPGHSKEEVRLTLIRMLQDPAISVRYVADDGKVSERAPPDKSQPPSKLVPEVQEPLARAVAATWPNLPVVPFMDASATDGIYTRAAGIPTFGVAGIAIDPDQVRAHGRDERVGVAAFYTDNAFYFRYLKSITSP